MPTNTHSATAYEPLGMELHEVNRSRYSSGRLGVDSTEASSFVSNITNDSRIDDAERSLIPQEERTLPYDQQDEAPVDHLPRTRASRKRRYRFKGWKVGVATAAAMTTLVLFTNCVITLWASLKYGLENGIGTAHDGDCDTVNAWSLGLHIVINGLSSALLSASNYTMQCVTAPTRRECDAAHSRGDWLDIGIPSVRNLSRISWQRRILWAMLALSSTPIHLLYNSAVFKTLDDNNYIAIITGPKFLDDDFIPTRIGNDAPGWSIPYTKPLHQTYVTNYSSFVQLSTDECIKAYAKFYISGYTNVIAVTNNDTDTNIYFAGTKWSWLCTDYWCGSVDSAKGVDAANWTVQGKRIEYCLSQTTESHCKLQFSMHLLVVVIVCNLVKCAAMFWTIFQQREVTFVTFGDALHSWLDEPDQSTIGCCFKNLQSLARTPDRRRFGGPQAIGRNTRRWRLAVGRRRWTTIITICSIAVAAVGVCLGFTIDKMTKDTNDTITSLGFGAVNTNMLLEHLPADGTTGLLSSILIANLPQVILSFVYLSYNALFTGMHLGYEYDGYEVHRKPLRVTTPCGQQRRTYWLQLPFSYGIPLICSSSSLHWLISQAVFLVRTEIYLDGVLKKNDQDYWPEFGGSTGASSVGISPAPMVVILIIGSCITLLAISVGFMKLRGHSMPIAGSCSFAIAAATHRPKEDVDAAVLPVKWGEVVGMGTENVGHCCFTSQEVVEVVAGRKYA